VTNDLNIHSGRSGNQIDVLRFLVMPDESANASCCRQYNAKGEYKGDASDIITAVDDSGYGQWKHIKNPQGWPWDLKLYDQNFVYDWITEGADGWSADPDIGPKSYKKFIQNHGDGEDGLPMFPRYIDSVSNHFVIKIPPELTKYATFSNCKQVGEPVSLGAITQVLNGPFQINHGGDVGTVATLIHQYFWTDGDTPVLEENYYALDFGWVAWKLQRKTGGFYQITNETIETLVFSVDEVKVVFPCF
jgi:hypothetical protein